MMQNNILITGKPGCGKTTLFKKILRELGPINLVGFYTDEIRKSGYRKGFLLKSFDGNSKILAHVGLKGNVKVGKYGVDIAGFEKFFEQLNFSDPSIELIGIDEIGKMECFSEKFVRLLIDILDCDRMVLATIAQEGGGVISRIKERPDIRLFEITKDTQDLAFDNIIQLLQYLLTKKG